MTSHQVGVAAEALTASLFARVGCDISVQYGANQPEYDLVVVTHDKLLKVSRGAKTAVGGSLNRSSRALTTTARSLPGWHDTVPEPYSLLCNTRMSALSKCLGYIWPRQRRSAAASATPRGVGVTPSFTSVMYGDLALTELARSRRYL
jgi:hypothetical protein